MVLCTTCDAGTMNPKGAVNILARNDYLRSPAITSIITNKCGVKLSCDEYYYFGECFCRLTSADDLDYYDIVILPADLYELLKNTLVLKGSDLNRVVKGYSPNIKKFYLSRNYPSNVVYFVVSLYGFIFNPKLINFLPTDSSASIFEKIKNTMVILTADAPALWNLIDNKKDLSHIELAAAFKQLIQNIELIRTADGYSDVYDKEEFGLALQRSGVAASILKSSKNRTLAFYVHPKYSIVSPDLMVALNARSETQCVAKVLASKEVLDIVQKETNYLSPYSTGEFAGDPVLQKVYKPVFDNTRRMQRFDTVLAERLNEVRGLWFTLVLHVQAMATKKNYHARLPQH